MVRKTKPDEPWYAVCTDRATRLGDAFSAKDFRTWAGTALAAEASRNLKTLIPKPPPSSNLTRAIERVAERLGNAKAVCRKCYVHPTIFDAYMDRSLLRRSKAAQKRSSRKVFRAASRRGGRAGLATTTHEASDQARKGPLAAVLARTLGGGLLEYRPHRLGRRMRTSPNATSELDYMIRGKLPTRDGAARTFLERGGFLRGTGQVRGGTFWRRRRSLLGKADVSIVLPAADLCRRAAGTRAGRY